MFLFIGCYYDDSCPRDAQLKYVNIQIANEKILLRALTSNPLPWSDEIASQVETEQDNLSMLLIDKAVLEISPCK